MKMASLNIISYNVRGMKNDKKGEQSIVGLKKKNGTSFYCKKLIAISIRRNLDGVKNGMDIAYGAWEPLIAKGLQSYVKKK